FDTLSANRVEIGVQEANERSRRVAERLGFVLEGRLRRRALDAAGRPVDRLVFSLIPGGYRRLPGAPPAPARGGPPPPARPESRWSDRRGRHDRAGGHRGSKRGRRRQLGAVTMQLREMDERVTYLQQLQADDGPVVLINQFNVAPEDADRFLEAWAADAAFMKGQPGFIAAQLHRG